MANGEQKAKSVVVLPIILVAMIALSVVTGYTFFKKATNKNLQDLSNVKMLELKANLSSELALVRQMVKDPMIRAYIKDPTDEATAALAIPTLGGFMQSFPSKTIFWVSDKDKAFWSDLKYSYTVDAEDPNSYWYKMTLYETPEYNFNINYNPDLNQTNLWVNAVVRDENKNPIGIAGTSIPLTAMMDILYSTIDKKTQFYIYDKNGIVQIARDKSLLGAGVTVKSQFKALENLKNLTPTSQVIQNCAGFDILVNSIDFLGYYMVIGVSANALDVVPYCLTPLAVGFVILLIVVIAIAFSKLYALLRVLVRAAEDLSSGHADLRKRIVLDVPSYFGIIKSLSNALNAFIEKLQGIVKAVKSANQVLSASGTTLKDSAADTASSITEIISNIDNMAENFNRQSDSVHSTSSAVTQITSNISSLENMIETQSQSVERATGDVGQIVNNIKAVNDISTSLSESFVELRKKTKTSVEHNAQMGKMITDIQEQSKALHDANVTIASIAEQTNLLAMNAAIEAAHAGKLGQGFAVVAGEIRKLSETSNMQTKTIGEKLSAIEESIEAIVGTAKVSQEVMTSTANQIETTDNLVQKIAESMKTQTADTDQLTLVINTLDQNSSQVKSAAVEMTQASSAILSEVRNLEEASDAIKGGMSEMSIGAKKINETGATLSGETNNLSSAIEGVREQLGQFEV